MFLFFMLIVRAATTASNDMQEKIVEPSRKGLYGDESAQKIFAQSLSAFVVDLKSFMSTHQDLKPLDFKEIVDMYAAFRQASADKM
jgi:hypothetical protein